MAGSTNTTPTSCEDASGSGGNSPLTPTKLMFSDSTHDDFVDNPHGSSHTAASTPSTSPKKATKDDEGHSLIIQDRSVASAAGDDMEEEPDLIRMLFGCMFTYAILGVWIWSVFALFAAIKRDNCVAIYEDELEGDHTGGSTVHCVEQFYGKLGCTHTITFGLISAVVITETDPKNESAIQRLRAITKPIFNRRKAKNATIFEAAVCRASLMIPAVYVISWVAGGIWCLIFSISQPDGSSGPLFYTGKAFLGIAIKQSYQFFGTEAAPSVKPGTNNKVDEETGLRP